MVEGDSFNQVHLVDILSTHQNHENETENILTHNTPNVSNSSYFTQCSPANNISRDLFTVNNIGYQVVESRDPPANPEPCCSHHVQVNQKRTEKRQLIKNRNLPKKRLKSRGQVAPIN